MTLSHSIFETSRRLVRSVWRRSVGRSAVFSALYGSLWRRYLAFRGTTVVSGVAGRTATFDVSTRSEYVRATEFGGEGSFLEAMLRDVEDSETVWDVGACVGTHSCLLADAVPSGAVVAIEPEPSNAERLRENLSRNARAVDWTVLEVALGDVDDIGTLTSEFSERGSGHHYLSEDETGDRVPVRRGESLVAGGIAQPDVLKIDVQGYELAVLKGLGTLLDDVRAIYVEIHTEKCRRYGTTALAVESMLRDAGFTVEQLQDGPSDRPSVYFVRAVREATRVNQVGD
ncbi:FkbM family methyltransferase [Halorubellus salinus]|uniref:FkbM family methyltransferase n=1 Tax=Halorubellus salinus TaxID=755309 RepID=UPI001D07064A|nr:FkbM family methyltransferase [Halorubellus salinus]